MVYGLCEIVVALARLELLKLRLVYDTYRMKAGAEERKGQELQEALAQD